MFLQDHRTPLHVAAQWGNDDIVKTLLEEGADVNIKDKVSQCDEILNDHFIICVCIPTPEGNNNYSHAMNLYDQLNKFLQLSLYRIDICGCGPNNGV